MERRVGTVSRGIRCPIIKEGDDLVTIVTNCITEASRCEGFDLKDRDKYFFYFFCYQCFI